MGVFFCSLLNVSMNCYATEIEIAAHKLGNVSSPGTISGINFKFLKVHIRTFDVDGKGAAKTKQ